MTCANSGTKRQEPEESPVHRCKNCKQTCAHNKYLLSQTIVLEDISNVVIAVVPFGGKLADDQYFVVLLVVVPLCSANAQISRRILK